MLAPFLFKAQSTSLTAEEKLPQSMNSKRTYLIIGVSAWPVLLGRI